MPISLSDFDQLGPYEWQLDTKFTSGMNVPVVLFTQEKMLKESLNDRSIEQAINASCLPGVVSRVCVMPDMHQGYGFPIGGVAAMSTEEGVIVPGAIGYDINCGVRLLASEIPFDSIKIFLDELIAEINNACPSGVGKGGAFKISRQDLKEVCLTGVRWAEKRTFMQKNESDVIEDEGCMVPDHLNGISKKAFDRGLPQLGSLGAGNHFIEIDRVTSIFDQQTASVFGIKKDMIAVQIHSGSRGFGHQVCTDYVRLFNEGTDHYKYRVPDRELVCAPVYSKLGRNYFSAMCAAANFAFVNRQLLTESVREAFNAVLAKNGIPADLKTVYDLAHNIGKLENLFIDGKMQQVFVHRKGATRALGKHHDNLPEIYQETGQPVLVPGSMGTHSWVLAGNKMAEKKSLNSCCHGAGRVLSRSKARKKINASELISHLKQKGITVLAGSYRTLSEEAPQAYKAVDDVVDTITSVGIARKVALLTPLAVVKG